MVVFLKQFVMNVQPKLIEEVDLIVKSEKLYSSRNEFIRDAVRSKVMECRLLKMRGLAKGIAKKAVTKGWGGEFPSKERREKIAKQYLKEKGFSSEKVGRLFD